jgi:hypothetical protein
MRPLRLQDLEHLRGIRDDGDDLHGAVTARTAQRVGVVHLLDEPGQGGVALSMTPECRPAGIKNSMSWILVHLATGLWVSHALLTGTRTQYDPLSAGLALSAVRGIEFGASERPPAPSAADPTAHVDAALKALRTDLGRAMRDVDSAIVYADRTWHTGWWFLIGEVGEFADHAGQASYLRKLVASERRRQVSGRRAGATAG